MASGMECAVNVYAVNLVMAEVKRVAVRLEGFPSFHDFAHESQTAEGMRDWQACSARGFYFLTANAEHDG